MFERSTGTSSQQNAPIAGNRSAQNELRNAAEVYLKALVNRAKNGDVNFKHTRFGRNEAMFGELDRTASGSVTICKRHAGSQES